MFWCLPLYTRQFYLFDLLSLSITFLLSNLIMLPIPCWLYDQSPLHTPYHSSLGIPVPLYFLSRMDPQEGDFAPRSSLQPQDRLPYVDLSYWALPSYPFYMAGKQARALCIPSFLDILLQSFQARWLSQPSALLSYSLFRAIPSLLRLNILPLLTLQCRHVNCAGNRPYQSADQSQPPPSITSTDTVRWGEFIKKQSRWWVFWSTPSPHVLVRKTARLRASSRT